jgi:gas vesicle protein
MGTTAEELRLRAEIDQQRADLTRDLEMVGDKVSPTRIVERRTEAAKGRLRSMRDAVMGSADDVSSSASDRMSSVRDTASGMAGQVTGAVSHTEDRIERGTRGNPLAAGLVAFGFGLLVATVIPESRRERQIARKVQPQLEHVAQAAVEAGQGVAEELAPAAQEAGSQVGQVAKDAAGELGQTVKEHAGDAADTARDAAHDVKDRSTS